MLTALRSAALFGAAGFLIACGQNSSSGSTTDAGSTSNGGATNASGGAVASNGGVSSASGGSAGANGGTSSASGGTPAATGGSAANTGGSPASGGAGTGGSANPGDSGVGNLPGWTLVWHDEFDGAQGALPNANNWVFETGGTGWGNNELEYYTARPDNAALDGQGFLVITAKKESYMGSDYTSARIKTAGKFDQAYGRFESRIKVPQGQGMWPAFWMLGNDIDTAGWPQCGEIDIMENIGKEPTMVHGTIHGPNYSNGTTYTLPGGAKFADGYHVFAVEWEAAAIRFYVDGALYGTHVPTDLPGNAKWVYDHPYFVLLNVAVGGQFPGNPDGTTTFPQEMSVDYVRVYTKQ
jgi:hypothetical protein